MRPPSGRPAARARQGITQAVAQVVAHQVTEAGDFESVSVLEGVLASHHTHVGESLARVEPDVRCGGAEYQDNTDHRGCQHRRRRPGKANQPAARTAAPASRPGYFGSGSQAAERSGYDEVSSAVALHGAHRPEDRETRLQNAGHTRCGQMREAHVQRR